MYVALFFLFVFGTLILAVFQTKKSLTLFSSKLNYFLLAGFSVCFILGAFFIQKTGGTNSTQFLITDMMLFPIYTALAATFWLGKIKNNIIIISLIVIIVLFTIPRVVYATVRHFLVPRSILVDNAELSAMRYIQKTRPKTRWFFKKISIIAFNYQFMRREESTCVMMHLLLIMVKI